MSSQPIDRTAATQPVADLEPRLSARLAMAFAPVHKRAFGVATGVAAGLIMLVITLFEVMRTGGEASPLLLLNEYFAGYRVSVSGAFIGLLWGFATGFVMGWFLAFCRNFVVAAWIFWIRTRAELRETREFLDHI